ncbi:MAG: chemotaxis protein CheB [Solirubrobacterales bacterium]|nr:chemotaxis protein CheB [Solirubrobacterales bacterium]MBV9714411.1 chemotaxis protein CheB [Solirubrobacterales bacterium]
MPADRNAHRDLVVIGASAGGVETLIRVVAGLPRDLAASICIVVHIAPGSPSALAGILQRSGPLPCRQAADGDPLVPGHILVAPPDHHLVIKDDHAHLTVGPRENGHRPAVDTLFRSAAAARGGRVIGVVLSGNRDDGAAGLGTIKQHGGAAIVQDPAEALFPGMPTNALANVNVDAVVPSPGVAQAIAKMVKSMNPPPNEPQGPGNSSSDGEPMLACPECGGVLVERGSAGVAQWLCQVGHRYSAESLADEQAVSVETALWTAIRALRERSALLQRMADQCHARGQARSARSFRRKADDAHEQADLVGTALREAARGTLRQVSGEVADGLADEQAS